MGERRCDVGGCGGLVLDMPGATCCVSHIKTSPIPDTPLGGEPWKPPTPEKQCAVIGCGAYRKKGSLECSAHQKSGDSMKQRPGLCAVPECDKLLGGAGWMPGFMAPIGEVCPAHQNYRVSGEPDSTTPAGIFHDLFKIVDDFTRKLQAHDDGVGALAAYWFHAEIRCLHRQYQKLIIDKERKRLDEYATSLEENIATQGKRHAGSDDDRAEGNDGEQRPEKSQADS